MESMIRDIALAPSGKQKNLLGKGAYAFAQYS